MQDDQTLSEKIVLVILSLQVSMIATEVRRVIPAAGETPAREELIWRDPCAVVADRDDGEAGGPSLAATVRRNRPARARFSPVLSLAASNEMPAPHPSSYLAAVAPLAALSLAYQKHIASQRATNAVRFVSAGPGPAVP